jgi:tetratricopeptide (TPR) repeat protein
MDEWYGNASRSKPVRRADAFALARTGDKAAVDKLLAIASDSEEAPLNRANALGYLARFGSDSRVFPVFEWALGDTDSVVRAIAALRFPANAAHKAAAVNDLAHALTDKIATVRLASAVSLVGLGVRDFQPPLAEPFREAMKLYVARAEMNNDDAQQQFAAGRFFLLIGDPAKASEALSASLRMDKGPAVQYYLAYALVQQTKYEEARAVLESIAAADQQYASAQALLKSIVGK